MCFSNTPIPECKSYKSGKVNSIGKTAIIPGRGLILVRVEYTCQECGFKWGKNIKSKKKRRK